MLICCVDGLEGFPEAIAAVFPTPGSRPVSCTWSGPGCATSPTADRKKVAAALRPVYTAANAEDAWAALERFDEQWGAQYPMITKSWSERWEHIIPFLSLPAALRQAVYTTNSIENLNRQIRKAIKTRGSSPTSRPRPS